MADAKNVSADRMDIDNLKSTVKDLQDGLKVVTQKFEVTQAKVDELEGKNSALEEKNSALEVRVYELGVRVCELEEGATIVFEHTSTLRDLALKVSTSTFTLESSYTACSTALPTSQFSFGGSSMTPASYAQEVL